MENKKRIGEILVEKGKLRVGDIDKALVNQQESDKPLGEILVEKGLINYDDVLDVLKEQGWEYKNSDTILGIEEHFKKLEDFWVESLLIPLKIENNIMYITAYNPHNSDSLKRIRKEYKVKGIKIYVDTKTKIEKKLCDLFGFCFTIKPGENLTENYQEKEESKGTFYISEQDIKEDVQGVVLERLNRGYKIIIENDEVVGIYKLTVY